MLKKYFEEFKLKNLGDNHDLYVQSDTLVLADVLKCALKYMNMILLIFCLHLD